MTTTDIPCTCHVPRSVKLSSCPTSKALLLENLSQLGWSPVQWEDPRVPPPTSNGIRNLFVSTNHDENQNQQDHHHQHSRHRLKYRSEESGGKMTVEPKESLELEQSQLYHSNDEQDDDAAASLEYQQVKEWCLTLSKIAQVVNQMLDIPPNVLLVNDDLDDSNVTNDDNGSSDDNNNDKDRLDLLRVFYYHQVPNHQKGDENTQCFGSSPHTDWGSWTVVWQDNVGGLETFCRRCQKWIPVPPPSPPLATATASTNHQTITTTTTFAPSNQPHIWNCIVHVGDLASLALGKEQHPVQPSTGHDNSQEGLVQWPSPRHRVVSPTQTTRTSLVYFAYPPPSLSLCQLQEALVDWNKPRGLQLPLSEYYLLQDQSSSNTSIGNDDPDGGGEQQAMASYQQLRNRSIRNVIHTKWTQVQRESL